MRSLAYESIIVQRSSTLRAPSSGVRAAGTLPRPDRCRRSSISKIYIVSVNLTPRGTIPLSMVPKLPSETEALGLERPRG
jgi:hypothetical protein